MQTLRGIAVSPGIAIGPAIVIDTRSVWRFHRAITQDGVAGELARMDEALSRAHLAAEAAEIDARERLGPEYASILGAHAQMIRDPTLRREARDVVSLQLVDAEHAIFQVLEKRATKLDALVVSNPYLAGRAADLRDVERQILEQFHGGQTARPWKNLGQPVLLLAHDLSPSETAELDPTQVLGFATEAGGLASHTAIVAAALEIPAVVGLGDFLDLVPACCDVIIDGDDGLVILNPDEATLTRYREKQSERNVRAEGLAQLAGLPAQTLDGTLVELLGNIEFPSETASCLERGAEGIGLYRSEFLYMANAQVPPSEEEQYLAYVSVVKTLPDRPVTIRTLDLGADKLTAYAMSESDQRNPYLGLRSLRLSLRNLPLFRTQLRAILRASVHGDVRVMFPLVTTLDEFRRAKAVLNQVRTELIAEGITPRDPLQVGMMIEVPSAALIADHLAREADFLSIGTNDLVQYTLAVDRTNPTVADLFCAADPAVIRLIAMVIAAARNAGKPLTVCGAMGGDPLYTTLLIGLGLRSLSMPPHQIPEVKNIVRVIRRSDAEALAASALQKDTAETLSRLLADHLRTITPQS